jgi:hypothetical protein
MAAGVVAVFLAQASNGISDNENNNGNNDDDNADVFVLFTVCFAPFY